MTRERGLTRLSTSELRALHDKIASGSVGVPLTSAGLQSSGLGAKPWVAEHLGGFDKPGVLAALELLLAERTQGEVPSLDLVWTGPEAQASTARDTWVVSANLTGLKPGRHGPCVVGRFGELGAG